MWIRQVYYCPNQRRIFISATRPSRQRPQLDRHARPSRSPELRSQGGESEREGGTGSAHAGGTARHHRGEAEGDRGLGRRAPHAELTRAARPPQDRSHSARRSQQWPQTRRPASVDTECETGGKRNPKRYSLLAAGERSLPGQDRPGIGGAAQARNPGSTGEDAADFNFDPSPSRPENFGLLHLRGTVDRLELRPQARSAFWRRVSTWFQSQYVLGDDGWD